MKRRHRSAGFSLVEAIVALTVMGIIAGIAAVFMSRPIEGYFDSVRRAELTDAAEAALQRLRRDVRLALPNSLRIVESNGVVTNADTCGTAGFTCYIEFIMTSAGGSYRDHADGSTCGNFLYQTDINCPPAGTETASESDFDVLGPMPASPTIQIGDFVVVYNLGPGYEPANAYRRGEAHCDATPAAPGCNIAAVTAVAANSVTLDANPFVQQVPPLPSPSARFQVVPGGVRAVSITCPTSVAGNLTRFWNYGFAAVQPTVFAPGTPNALLSTNATCTATYTANATGRNGLLSVTLTLASGGETVTLFEQIHVDNAP